MSIVNVTFVKESNHSGFIGRLEQLKLGSTALIKNSYSLGGASGGATQNYLGGFAAAAMSAGSLTNNYYVLGTGSKPGIPGVAFTMGLPLSALEENSGLPLFFTDHAVYTGTPSWDFVNVWDLDVEVEAPVLQNLPYWP